jgi:NO-binding membrane sensor protein with MHYT domain
MLSALIVALYLFEAAIWIYAHLLKEGNDPASSYKLLGLMLVGIAVVMVGVVALAAKVFAPKRT